jgi:hypothetical protein
MKKIIAHIGPPKTATTAIRYYYADVGERKNKIVFIGVYQPREVFNWKGKNSLIKNISKYVRTPSDVLKKSIIQELDNLFKTYDTIVFSEEVILHGLNWQKKLINLYELIKNYNHHVVTCLRDIRNALPSYFGQIYNNIENKYKEYENFENSKYAEIYDYDIVDKELNIFSSVKYVAFESLINNRCLSKDILPNTGDDSKVELIKTNIKKRVYDKENAKIVVLLPPNSKLLKSLLSKLRKLGLFAIHRYLAHKLRPEIQIEIKLSNRVREIHMRNLKFLESRKI